MSSVTRKSRYVTELGSVEFRRTEVPRHGGMLRLLPGQGEDGYGTKITTDYECRVNGRWHRVYLILVSNSGSYFIQTNKQRYFISDIPDHVRFPGSFK